MALWWVTITAASHNTLQVHVLDTIQNLFQTTIMVALSEFYSKEGYEKEGQVRDFYADGEDKVIFRKVLG